MTICNSRFQSMDFILRAQPPSVALVQRLNSGMEIKRRKVKGIWVPVIPHAAAKKSACDENVALQIRDNGGEAYHVWDATENGPFLELEAHVIWNSPKGELVDVSPSLVGASRHFVFPSAEAFVRPYPGNIIASLADDREAKYFAAYLMMAHAVLAPQRVVGFNVITRVNVEMWVRDFIRDQKIDADPKILVGACMKVVQGWRG